MQRRCAVNDRHLCATTASIAEFAVDARATRRREGPHRIEPPSINEIFTLAFGASGAVREGSARGADAELAEATRARARRSAHSGFGSFCGLLPRAARCMFLFEIPRGRDDLRPAFGLELLYRDSVGGHGLKRIESAALEDISQRLSCASEATRSTAWSRACATPAEFVSTAESASYADNSRGKKSICSGSPRCRLA
jgi:hypothetical protein